MGELPTLRAANRLYLFTLLLVVFLGSSWQLRAPISGLIATEFILILPPGLIYLRLAKLPFKETLRLRIPSPPVMALSLLTGLGASFLALWLGNLLADLFGYTFPVPPGFIPTNFGEAALVLFAMVIAAPMCEETLFRGVIQRGYERRGPWSGILGTALLFAIYHLSFQRYLAILPVALLLCYSAWRANSLLASMLVHFAYNSLAGGLFVVNSLRPDIPLTFFGSFPGALLGLALIAGSILLLNWFEPAPAIQPVEPEDSAWFSRVWPVGLAVLISVVIASSELLLGVNPQLMAREPIQLNPPPWKNTVDFHYELRNFIDQPVGEARCSITPAAQAYSLDCQVDQQAFDAQRGKSRYATEAYTLTLQARWEAENLQILNLQARQQGSGMFMSYQVAPQGQGLLLQVNGDPGSKGSLELPSNALVEGEWAWRLSALPFNSGYFARASLGLPTQYAQERQRNQPELEDLAVVVFGAEPIAVPAGNFIAWRVELGKETAWYDVNAPHQLLQYDNGFVTYVLK